MEESKDNKIITLVTILLVCGTCSLLFTLFMKILNAQVLQLFLRTGIICLGLGLLLLSLQVLTRYLPSGKKKERSRQ
jgi:hypothetical protein